MVMQPIPHRLHSGCVGNGLYQPEPLTSQNNLGVKSNMAFYDQYLGVAYVTGKLRGVRVSIPSITIFKPIFLEKQNGDLICVATGDMNVGTKRALLTWMWRVSPDKVRIGVAWRAREYRIGDKPGQPTGAWLLASSATDIQNSTGIDAGETLPLDGQVWIGLGTDTPSSGQATAQS